MLVVIGSSFTVEYALKGLYEETVGHVSEWFSNHQSVDEDRYAYQVARQCADFVHVRPFYEFPFFQSLRGLWRQTAMWGPHPIRKWERKAWLSLDYGVEAIYCGLVELASHAVYGVETADTYAIIEHAPQTIFTDFPHIRKVKQIGSDSFVVVIPRYQEFADLGLELAKRNVQFAEIAGNRQILLSVIAPGSWQPGFAEGDVAKKEVLLAADILTQAGMKRFLILSPVSELTTLLNRLTGPGVKVEHIYDF